MMRPASWPTFQRLECLFRAAGALVIARVRVELDDQTVLADLLTKEHCGTGRTRSAGQVSEAWLRDLAWAINGLARRLPFRADCLVRVLAAEQILRHRVPFEIHVGAGRMDDEFAAHAWLTCQGIELTGGAVPGLERLQQQKSKT